MKITKITQQKKDPNRVSIFLDNKFAFGLANKFLVEFDLFKDKNIQEKEIADILREDVGEKLKTKIYKLVLSRPRSEKEVRDYVQKKFREGRYKVEKEYWSELTETIVTDLKELGLINDEEFARWFVENRKEFKPRGKRMLQMELKQKGIDDSVIQESLRLDNDDELEMAKRLVMKKEKSLMRYNDEKRKEKLNAFLQRKGFGWDTIKSVIE